MNGLPRKADLVTCGAWIAACAIILVALIARLGIALAAGNSSAPETIADAGWFGIRQVLVIPQQCSREAVSTLCDLGDSDDIAAGDNNRRDRSAARSRHGVDYGTLADYESEHFGEGPVPAAPGYVTIPPAIPAAPASRAR